MTANLNEKSVTNSSSLYEEDFYLWIQTTTNQIKERNFDNVDWENVLEELDSLARSDKRELESRLTVLLEHLLKLAYWEAERQNNARGWLLTVAEQRRQIKRLLKDSPSLKAFLQEVFTECYADACENASIVSGQDVFPKECPFTLEETLTDKEIVEPI